MIGKKALLTTVTEEGSNRSTGYKDLGFRGVLLRYFLLGILREHIKSWTEHNVWNRSASIVGLERASEFVFEITETKGMETNRTEQGTEPYRLLQEKKEAPWEGILKKYSGPQKWIKPWKTDRRGHNFKKKIMLAVSKTVENRTMVLIFDHQNVKSQNRKQLYSSIIRRLQFGLTAQRKEKNRAWGRGGGGADFYILKFLYISSVFTMCCCKYCHNF